MVNPLDGSVEAAMLELRLASRPLLTHAASSMELAQTFFTPPPDASRLDLPGPEIMLLRPCLDAAEAGGRVAARVVGGDGHAAPAVLLLQPGRTLTVPVRSEPLSVCPAGNDMAWAVFRDRLALIGPEGELRAVRDVGGFRLTGTASGGAWLTGLREAWYVAADATPSGPYRWSWPSEVAQGEALLAMIGRAGGGEMLLPDGQRERERERERALSLPTC